MDPSERSSDLADQLDTKPVQLNSADAVNISRAAVTSSATIHQPEERYDTNHARRGVALIINQEQFSGKPNRDGSDRDRDRIGLALHRLGFDVRVFDDPKRKEVFAALKQVASEDHSQCDCLVVVVMTHGKEKTLYAADSSYEVDKLWEPFVGDACPSLVGKPKLFFIQACRGAKFDQGVKAIRELTFGDTVDASAAVEPLHYVIPTMADLLVMYSTYDGHYSWRNPVNGSWFIQTLSSELESNAYRKELLQLLTGVVRTVAYQYQSNVPDNAKMDAKKQVPCFLSSLTKELYFLPKPQQ